MTSPVWLALGKCLKPSSWAWVQEENFGSESPILSLKIWKPAWNVLNTQIQTFVQRLFWSGDREMVSPWFFLIFIKSFKQELERRVSSKSNHCSGRGPGFSSQDIIIWLSSSEESDVFWPPLDQVHTQYTYLHIGKTLIQKKIPKRTITYASNAS